MSCFRKVEFIKVVVDFDSGLVIFLTKSIIEINSKFEWKVRIDVNKLAHTRLPTRRAEYNKIVSVNNNFPNIPFVFCSE